MNRVRWPETIVACSAGVALVLSAISAAAAPQTLKLSLISRRVLKQFRADKRRTVTEPTPADAHAAQRAFTAVTERWAAASPHNRDLLALVRSEIGKLHSAKDVRQ